MKQIKWIIAFCLCLAIVGIFSVKRLSDVREIRGCSLPFELVDGYGHVVMTIKPSVMYNGQIFYWERMSADSQKELPEGYLPDGYIYAGDIRYTCTETMTEDLQFAAVFEVSGQLYHNPDEPERVCICLTTFWLKHCYVLFKAGVREEPSLDFYI